MRRQNQAIDKLSIKNAINPQISYGMGFAEWEALTVVGATLTERMEWDRGDTFPIWFKAKVVAYARLHRLVQTHVEAARSAASNKKR